jgi:hypothetical protein
MKNITVSVSDRVHYNIRVWAAQHNTSLSRIVQDFLECLPDLPSARSFPIPTFVDPHPTPANLVVNPHQDPDAASNTVPFSHDCSTPSAEYPPVKL